MSVSGKVSKGVHRLNVRVYYEDTDFSGLVYHANYLKFCERGRSESLKLSGIHHTALAQQGLNFVVRHMVCDFRAPARIDDIVTVTSRLKDLSGARFILDQQVLLDQKVLFEAQVTLALVNQNGRPQRIPASLADALSQS